MSIELSKGKPFVEDRSPYVGTRLPEILQERERTYAWLARKTGYSKPHISEVVSGKRVITNAFAASVSKVLDLPESTIFLWPSSVSESNEHCVEQAS